MTTQALSTHTSIHPRHLAWLVFALGLLAQALWHGLQPPPQARAVDLPATPSTAALHAISLGDPIAAAKATMLWLQAFDNQPGISLPFRQLDYARVERWLDTILTLDPRGQYPLLSASRLYAAVPDPVRKRRMLDFVHQKFIADPNRRWPWLAHAVIVAQHGLHDSSLALKYARALADNSTGTHIPTWAQQMQIFVLQDMGAQESARILIGGLLDSGQVTDPHELRFLQQRLEELAPHPGDMDATTRPHERPLQGPK